MSYKSNILGVRFRSLLTHFDERGDLTEIFRNQWIDDKVPPVQWNFVRSNAHVLRGFHLHYMHTDYLALVEGKMQLALKDLRPESKSHNVSEVIKVSSSNQVMITIPPGVGHGFYFPTSSIHLYAVNEYWNVDDELACKWNDPDLKLSWPVANQEALLISEKDRMAQSFQSLLKNFYEQWKD